MISLLPSARDHSARTTRRHSQFGRCVENKSQTLVQRSDTVSIFLVLFFRNNVTCIRRVWAKKRVSHLSALEYLFSQYFLFFSIFSFRSISQHIFDPSQPDNLARHFFLHIFTIFDYYWVILNNFLLITIKIFDE